MAKLTLTHAAAATGVNRSTLHRAVQDGRLSREPDGRFDTAELLRAGCALRAPATEATGALETATMPAAPEPPSPALALTLEHERQLWERERALLLHQLDDAQARAAQLLQLLQADQQPRLLTAGATAAPSPAARGFRGWLQRWRLGG